ncbi:MAG: hypothetical protein WAK17_06505 [Candidatus Nitrosopolaris sp.]|jgi:hypothetical protein
MMPPDMTGMGPMDGGGGGGMDPSMMPDISGGFDPSMMMDGDG